MYGRVLAVKSHGRDNFYIPRLNELKFVEALNNMIIFTTY